MKREIIRSITVCLVLLSSHCLLATRTVSGKVLVDGKGLSGVVITDGFSLVSTDQNGYYHFSYAKEAQFVYVSTPSGYKAPVVDGVVRFFEPLSHNGGNIVVNFQLLKAKDDFKHRFLAFADIQLLRNEEIEMLNRVMETVANQMSTLDMERPVHVIDCGDLVFDRMDFFPSYIQALNALNLPVYRVVGNHDIEFNNRSNEGASSSFKNAFGPDYYAFERGEIHYVVLNNTFYLGRAFYYMGYLVERQLSWLEGYLRSVDPGSTVVVAMHIPSMHHGENYNLLEYNRIASSLVNNQPLYKLLAPYKAHIISGHTHTSSTFIISDNIIEHNIAAISGSWWQTPICPDGTPSGYMLFDVDGSEIIWSYKSLAGEDQFRAYKPGSDTKQSGALIVNVWNYDPQWKVEWFQDGKGQGEMERYDGLDPLAVEILSDKSKLIHSWTSPRITHHLFRSFPKSNAKQVIVKVTDRFGRIYEQKLMLSDD